MHRFTVTLGLISVLTLLMLSASSVFAQEPSSDAQRIAELEAQLKKLKGSAAEQSTDSSPAVSPVAARESKSSESPAERFAPGWIVHVRPLGSSPSDASRDLVGSFVTMKGDLTLEDHLKDPELRFFQDPAHYTIEGWFKAAKEGRYSFIAELVVPPVLEVGPGTTEPLRCAYTLQIEDNVVLDLGSFELPPPTKAFESKSIVNGVDLSPGLYRVRQVFSCSSATHRADSWCGAVQFGIASELRERVGLSRCRTTPYRAASQTALSLRVKVPGSAAPQAVGGDVMVHRVG